MKKKEILRSSKKKNSPQKVNTDEKRNTLVSL